MYVELSPLLFFIKCEFNKLHKPFPFPPSNTQTLFMLVTGYHRHFEEDPDKENSQRSCISPA